MANPILVGGGISKFGVGIGRNRRGDLITGHRVEPGHWSLSNQNNGVQLDAVHEKGKVWEVTRTDAEGNQSVGDFTVISKKGEDGKRRFLVLDLDRDGFQPLSNQ